MTTRRRSPSGYIELVRNNRNFRYLWFGQIVSLLGDWFNLIASAALISELTDSGVAISGLFIMRMIAPFIVSPIAGVFADRYNRKMMLIWSDVVRVFILLGFLFVRQSEHIWLLYALTGLQFAVSGFYFPARNAILPDVVSRRELGAANALSSATWSVMLSIGAALGGFSTGLFGVYPSFVIDAVTFAVSALLLMQISYHFVPDTSADTSIMAGIRELWQGLRYLRHTPDIFIIVMHKGLIGLIISSGFQVAQVVIAEDIFTIGESGGISLGLMYAFVGVGTGVGPIVARAITGDRDRPMRHAITVAYLVAGIGLGMSATLFNFPFVLLGTFLRGFGAGLAWVFSTQLLLMLLPDQVRGRVFGTEFAIQTLLQALGAFWAGSALDSGITVAGSLWFMAAATVIPAVGWAIWVAVGKHMPMPEEADT